VLINVDEAEELNKWCFLQPAVLQAVPDTHKSDEPVSSETKND